MCVSGYNMHPTRVSVKTGALLVYSCLITYKRLSQRYQVNMMINKGVIVNKTSSSNRDKSETTIQKALEERIPNHILHVQFERKISVSQSNLLHPLYVYNDLKRQKMPKRVKFFTLKWHRKQQHLFLHPFRSLQCIRFVEKNLFCREQAYQRLGLQKYCETAYSRSGVNQMWILKNSKELLDHLKCSKFQPGAQTSSLLIFRPFTQPFRTMHNLKAG